MAGFGTAFGEDFGGVGTATPTSPAPAPVVASDAPSVASVELYTPIEIPPPLWSTKVPGEEIPRVDVYSSGFALLGQVARPLSVTVTDCFKAAGTAVVSLAGEDDAEMAAAFEDPGCRIVVTLRGKVIFSGRRASIHWAGPEAAPTVTGTFVDDYGILTGILAWPIPANALTAQSTARWTGTGPLETVVKNLITANVAAARLNLPVTVEATAGRGPTVTISARMQPLSDYIQPLLDANNVGLRIRQSGSGLLVTYVAPATYPETLSEVGGQIVRGGWELEESSPTITRTIVGGQGEGTAREFQQVVNTTSESALGWKLETFVDARDTNVADELTARATTNNATGGEKLTARIPLQETSEFRCYSGTDGLMPGHRVPIELMGRTWMDTVTQITTTWDASNGLLVEPVAGGLESSAVGSTATRIAGLQRRIRALESTR